MIDHTGHQWIRDSDDKGCCICTECGSELGYWTLPLVNQLIDPLFPPFDSENYTPLSCVELRIYKILGV